MAATSPSVGPTWPDLLTRLLAREDLSLDEARWAMTRIMGGESTAAQIAGFLMALRAKVESVAEVRGLADVMLEHAHRIEVPGESMDIVGTGGDRFGTVNISTMSSVVIAATGLRVVKHGNRAASSKSGSADVLESLGVNLTLSPEQVRQVALDAGITFCFAQTFHPSMRHAGPARAELGVATAFNLLGPLTNPAQPTYAAVGVADARFLPIIAGVFADRGTTAAVFRGDEGLDEMSIAGPTSVLWVRGGEITDVSVHPSDVGLDVSSIDSIKGGLADQNAEVARRVFAGDAGPARDAVLLNTGTALAVAAGAGGVSAAEIRTAIGSGIERAAHAIDSGDAAGLLDRWVIASRTLARN